MLHLFMPTTRPRHAITETDRIAAVIDDAAARWPEDASSRAQLVLRLVLEGHRALLAERAAGLADRRAAIEESAGIFTGVYGKNYLRDLHNEWPA